MLRPAMRERALQAVVILALGAPSVARAEEPPDDPRDAFGLGRRDAEPVTCATALALACPWAPDAGSPAAVRTRLTRARLARIPLADADLDGAAGLAPGAGRDDSGVFYGGATGLENRWSLDGAPIDSPRTGALDSRVPLAFVEHVTITTAGLSARDRASTGAVIDAALGEGGATHQAHAQVWLGAAAPARVLPSRPASCGCSRPASATCAS